MSKSELSPPVQAGPVEQDTRCNVDISGLHLATWPLCATASSWSVASTKHSGSCLVFFTGGGFVLTLNCFFINLSEYDTSIYQLQSLKSIDTYVVLIIFQLLSKMPQKRKYYFCYLAHSTLIWAVSYAHMQPRITCPISRPVPSNSHKHLHPTSQNMQSIFSYLCHMQYGNGGLQLSVTLLQKLQ